MKIAVNIKAEEHKKMTNTEEDRRDEEIQRAGRRIFHRKRDRKLKKRNALCQQYYPIK